MQHRIYLYSPCLCTDTDTDTTHPSLTYIPGIILSFILLFFIVFTFATPPLSLERLGIFGLCSFDPFAFDHLDTIVRQDTYSK